MRHLILTVALWLGLALPGLAADQASLVADSLTIRSGSVLEARGHVEIFYQGRHLTAQALTYDRTTDRLLIEGPIWLDDGQGNLIEAQMADLAADLTEGILRSARLVLAGRLQLAAGAVARTDGGRYAVLKNVQASSCTICAGNATPLWEIRARQVIHDSESHLIWFTGAELRFAGVPVLYLPELRVPDPDLKRVSGFLLPSVRTTTLLGTGVKFPYFLTLGASRDLTVTPYLTSTGSRTVALRYRQAFTAGTITLDGALSEDGLLGPGGRGYGQGDGSFSLGQGFQLDFHLIAVSDPAYLLDYGISDDDRLNSTVAITRARRNSWVSAGVTGVQSLRAGEADGSFPSLLTDFTWERRFTPAILGGEAGSQLQTHTTFREATSPLDLNGDGVADGRDLARISAQAQWQRSWLLSPGIQVTTLAALRADDYRIAQDAAYPDTALRADATWAVELAWPFSKATAQATQTIAPVLEFVVSPRTGSSVPNEDSTLVEFDEGNLYAFDRFPGADAVEDGFRANLGLTYDALFASGLDLGLTAGRVIRLDTATDFPAASGLDGRMSDWLLVWSLSDGTAQGLALTNRMILADDLAVTKGELRLDVTRPGYALATGYSYVPADVEEDRPDAINELALDGSYDLTRAWTVHGTGRYNLDAATLAEAGVNLTFRNECLNVDLSLSRRFTASTSVSPSTVFGLSVELLGFGGSATAGPARQCRQ